MSEARTRVAGTEADARLRRYLGRPETPALAFLILLVVAFSVLSDKFLSVPNLESILTSVAVLGVIALAVNQVVLCGEIDISTGSMLGLCAVAGGAAAQNTGGFLLPLVAAVAVGALCGAINGTLVTLGRIPSIIVTLGMLYALRGVILLVTGGTWITGIPADTRVLGTGRVLGLGYPVVVLLLLFVVMERVRFLAFVLVGVFVGIASVIYLGRAGSVQTNTGAGLELQVVAAVVIGGNIISGGGGAR